MRDVVDQETGELLFEAGNALPPETLEQLATQGIKQLEVVFPEAAEIGTMFFDPTRYDFSKVGRLKFNTKLYGVSETSEGLAGVG